MDDSRPIAKHFPALAAALDLQVLGNLPTPLRTVKFGDSDVLVKCDDQSSELYGGNKVRKLEYLLSAAKKAGAPRVATFGTVGSHHALATTLYANSIGLPCTCFLSHQHKCPGIRENLLALVAADTDIVRYGGHMPKRLATVRFNAWDRGSYVIPAGGSSWLGTVGFVNAGLELAQQLEKNQLDAPDRIYIATGTMGSAVGLALGLTLAGVESRVEAVRVSMTAIANEQAFQQLAEKTVTRMRQLDPSVPEDAASGIRVRFRHSFFAGGYAHSDERIEEAINIAASSFGIELESTYTGKAFAAMLRDIEDGTDDTMLFWNTYNSTVLPEANPDERALEKLPAEFRRYLETDS